MSRLMPAQRWMRPASSRMGTPCARMAWYLPSTPSMRCSRYQVLPVRAHSFQAAMVSSTSSGCSTRAPAVVGGLLLRQADELEERVADVDVAAVGVAHPHAVVDGFADGAVELLAGLERARTRLHLVEHVVERVDDHADLVVGGACRRGTSSRASRRSGAPRCAMDSIGRLTTRCSQLRGEQRGDQADDHDGAEHGKIGAHAAADVVLRAQVDSAQRLAALRRRRAPARRVRRRCARRASSAGSARRGGGVAGPRVLREQRAVGVVERGGANRGARLQCIQVTLRALRGR